MNNQCEKIVRENEQLLKLSQIIDSIPNEKSIASNNPGRQIEFDSDKLRHRKNSVSSSSGATKGRISNSIGKKDRLIKALREKDNDQSYTSGLSDSLYIKGGYLGESSRHIEEMMSDPKVRTFDISNKYE